MELNNHIRNLRKYGNKPYTTAVIHGGPGANGEMAPVARVLSAHFGILEPLQTAASIEGLIDELSNLLQQHGTLPMTLIGHSWGAWLSFIFAARYPRIVKKLILISSGPYENKYAAEIIATRLHRFSEREKSTFYSLSEALNNPNIINKNELFAQIGTLISRVDSFNPVPSGSEDIEYRYNIYQAVWIEGVQWRQSGKLLQLGKNIQCPVVAIHGDYDPHPASGVVDPLSGIVKDFRFVILKHCGHTPWLEKEASNQFFEELIDELQ